MSREISFKRAPKYPSKQYLNLAQKEDRSKQTLTALLVAVLFIVAVSGFVKFGILDRYAKLAEARAAYEQVHNTLTSMEAGLADFDAVQEEYRSYSRNWMNHEESSMFVAVDRNDVLDLIERELMSKGTVKSVRIQNEMLVVTMSDMNLRQISTMLNSLRAEPIVKSASLTVASTEKTESENAKLLDFTVSITLKPADKEAGK